MEQITGSVTGVNGNLVSVRIDGSIRKNEVGYVLVDGKRLKGEIIRVGGGIADMQIYEMTNGIKVGDKAEFTGELMSVSLGPGLLTQIYDGLQNPLPVRLLLSAQAAVAKADQFPLQRRIKLCPFADERPLFRGKRKLFQQRIFCAADG